jgi:hypothetical protein
MARVIFNIDQGVVFICLKLHKLLLQCLLLFELVEMLSVETQKPPTVA